MLAGLLFPKALAKVFQNQSLWARLWIYLKRCIFYKKLFKAGISFWEEYFLSCQLWSRERCFLFNLSLFFWRYGTLFANSMHFTLATRYFKPLYQIIKMDWNFLIYFNTTFLTISHHFYADFRFYEYFQLLFCLGHIKLYFLNI